MTGFCIHHDELQRRAALCFLLQRAGNRSEGWTEGTNNYPIELIQLYLQSFLTPQEFVKMRKEKDDCIQSDTVHNILLSGQEITNSSNYLLPPPHNQSVENDTEWPNVTGTPGVHFLVDKLGGLQSKLSQDKSAAKKSAAIPPIISDAAPHKKESHNAFREELLTWTYYSDQSRWSSRSSLEAWQAWHGYHEGHIKTFEDSREWYDRRQAGSKIKSATLDHEGSKGKYWCQGTLRGYGWTDEDPIQQKTKKRGTPAKENYIEVYFRKLWHRKTNGSINSVIFSH